MSVDWRNILFPFAVWGSSRYGPKIPTNVARMAITTVLVIEKLWIILK